MRNRNLPGRFEAIVFAVDAAAVLLLVKAVFFGQVPVFFPAIAKIPVKKIHSGFPGDILSDSTGQVVFLEFTDQQGRGKYVVISFPGGRGRHPKPPVIAIPASAVFPKNHLPEKFFKIISG